MATTSLVVEMIVIGVFALIWIILFAFKCFGLDIPTTLTWLSHYKDWATGIVVISIAIAYQLGWSVNRLGYLIARNTFNRTIRKNVFKNEYENYELIRTTVLMKALLLFWIKSGKL